MQKNMFHKHQGVSPIHKMAYTGVFFAMAILFQYISQYMKFANTFVNLNFSLLFILPIFYYSGPFYGLGSLIFRFLIGVGIDIGSGNGMELGGTSGVALGHFILFICSSIAISFMFVYSKIFNNIKKHNTKIIIISICTVLSTTIIATLLNMFLFTPAFFAIYSHQKFSIKLTVATYENLTAFFFFIKNYWVGTFVVYFSANIVKFGLIYLVYFPLSKILRHFHPTIAYGKEK